MDCITTKFYENIPLYTWLLRELPARSRGITLPNKTRNKMRDRQGKNRGKCTSVGCQCTEYRKVQDLSNVRCEYCGHAPVKHIEAFDTNELGACTNCASCSSYVSEGSGSYSDCAYCECPAQYHKNADTSN